jgi:hypothetical protein
LEQSFVPAEFKNRGGCAIIACNVKQIFDIVFVRNEIVHCDLIWKGANAFRKVSQKYPAVAQSIGL